MKKPKALLLFSLARCVHVTSQIEDQREFEYIVIGGGSAGCVVARELSDQGFDTLLIERGDLPSKFFGSRTLYGLRDAVADPKLSQIVVTANGLRTAVANVLGGGSSVNLGIWIEENQEYYDALMEYLTTISTRSDLARWEDLLSGRPEATQWVKEMLANHDSDTQIQSGAAATNFSHPTVNAKQMQYAEAMEKVVGDWFGEYVGLNPQIQPGKSWTPHSLFTAAKEESGRARFSMAQAVLDANDHLTILVNSTVDQILPKRPHVTIYRQSVLGGQGRHRVDCVHYHPTGSSEPGVLGTIDTEVAKSPLEFDQLRRSANNIQNKQYLWQLRNPRAASGATEKVCLKGTAASMSRDVFALEEMAGRLEEVQGQGEIILSAGSILSPWLLFKSGIGPSHYTSALGVWNYVDNQWIGQNLQDRPVVGLSIEVSGASGDLRESETMISRHAAMAVKNQSEADAKPRVFPDNAFRQDRPDSLSSSNRSSPANLFHRKAMGFEDLFGGDTTEGIVWSSRMLFPPALRNLPLVDLLSDVNVACGSERRSQSPQYSGASPASRIGLTSYCAFVNVMDSCSANMAVWFTFLTHVKSRGQVRINRQGQMVVDPAYLVDGADKKDIIENVRTIFRMLLQYRGVFREVFQPITESQCPAHSFLTEQEMITSVRTVVEHYLDEERRGIVRSNEHLPFATEPQKVPNIDDDASIWEYVENHVMSMWHLVGSNSLGVVLDDEFHIDQVDQLSVIDGKFGYLQTSPSASALPIQTRMNPASTIMIMAKLAIDHKLRIRRGDFMVEQFQSAPNF